MYPKEYICFYVALMDAAWMQILWMGGLTMHSEADHQSPQFSLAFPQRRKWNLFLPSRCYLFAIELEYLGWSQFYFSFSKEMQPFFFHQEDVLELKTRSIRIQNFKGITLFVYIPICILYQSNIFLWNMNKVTLTQNSFLQDRYIEHIKCVMHQMLTNAL